MEKKKRVVCWTGESFARRGAAERLLRQYPDFVPALNNLSTICGLEGRLDEASATPQRALAHEPENVFALANLITFYFRAARLDDARAVATRFATLRPKRDDAWAKMAEALSYLGDDQGVLDVYRRAERAHALDELATSALLEHLPWLAA
ncbi:MAG TPA: hypothetical protein VFZ25_10945 [Chloroflexota bacterium]|nr:hypothetical protein [Chloroflexota bacterium]